MEVLALSICLDLSVQETKPHSLIAQDHSSLLDSNVRDMKLMLVSSVLVSAVAIVTNQIPHWIWGTNLKQKEVFEFIM